MLIVEKDLVGLGIFKKDYQNFINEYVEGFLITETVDGVETSRPMTEKEAYFYFVSIHNERAVNTIVKHITIEEYTKIKDKTTGNTALENDIKEAELNFTAFFMLVARICSMEDFLTSQSDGRVSIAIKEYSKTVAFLQMNALSLIKRWYND